jgi:hypothetical protein
MPTPSMMLSLRLLAGVTAARGAAAADPDAVEPGSAEEIAAATIEARFLSA